MARAWLDAAADLGVRVVHPSTFMNRLEVAATNFGVFLPDFGNVAGMPYVPL